MIKKLLYWINITLVALSLLLVLITLGFYFSLPTMIPVTEVTHEQITLPKGPFAREKEDYDAIGPPFMSLAYSPMTPRLPNLQNLLTYYGRNERPDANVEQALLHFAFTGSPEIVSIPAGKPLYLVYDANQPRLKYRFSPNNEETSLWIEAVPKDKVGVVSVAMKNEMGQIIKEPEEYALFNLPEREPKRFGGDKWEIGKWRVDGTLLARQRARWYGQDLFLQNHGGVEYEEQMGKQRIDFGEGDDLYSVSAGIGDAIAWTGERWRVLTPGKETLGYPLLVINKIDDRLMRLDLWDVEGKAKVALNLIKSMETPVPQNIQQVFKFVGARTRSQLLFEVQGRRMIISPHDWLLFIDGKWKKLTTPDEIDDYVDRKTVGPLFVIHEVARDEGRQILKGTIYNSTRTGMTEVEISLQQGVSPGFFDTKGDKKDDVDDDDDEEEEGFEEASAMPHELTRYKRYVEKLKNKYRGELCPYNSKSFDQNEVRTT